MFTVEGLGFRGFNFMFRTLFGVHFDDSYVRITN